MTTTGPAAEDDGGETPADDGGSDGGGDATALDDGGFGDLEAVCQDGDASGATDAGRHRRPRSGSAPSPTRARRCTGLNKEMYDTAVAFTEWCNEHGGILGREIVLSTTSTPSSSSTSRPITEACEPRLRAGRRRRGVRRGPQRRPRRLRASPTSPATSCRTEAAPPTCRCSRSRTRSTTIADGPLHARPARLPGQRSTSYGIMAVGHPVGAPGAATSSIEVAGVDRLRGRLQLRVRSPGRDRLGELRRRHEGQGRQDPRVHRPARRTSSSSPRRWTPPAGTPTSSCSSANFYDDQVRGGGRRHRTATSTSSRRSTRSRWPTRTRPRRTTWTSWSSTTRTARSPGSACRRCRRGSCSPQAATACGSELTARVPARAGGGARRTGPAGAARPADARQRRAEPRASCSSGSTPTASSTTRRPPQPTEGLYNCDPENVFELTGDYSEYGVRRRRADGAGSWRHGRVPQPHGPRARPPPRSSRWPPAASSSPTPPPASSTSPTARSGCSARSAYWQLHVDWGWPVPIALAVVLLVLAPGARGR